MWTETTFDLTRREIRTRRPFDQVVAAIEAKAPAVVLGDEPSNSGTRRY